MDAAPVISKAALDSLLPVPQQYFSPPQLDPPPWGLHWERKKNQCSLLVAPATMESLGERLQKGLKAPFCCLQRLRPILIANLLVAWGSEASKVLPAHGWGWEGWEGRCS